MAVLKKKNFFTPEPQDDDIADLVAYGERKPKFRWQHPGEKMKDIPNLFKEKELPPVPAEPPPRVAASPPVVQPPPPPLPSPTGGMENYEGLGSYNTPQVTEPAPSMPEEFPWQKALGVAARMTKPKEEDKLKPPTFGTPGPLRASPITKGLPDPILMALFGKPI